jgi:hypothetical protein
MESLDHLKCALDEEYIKEDQFRMMEEQYSFILRKRNGYIAYLKKRKEKRG